MIGYPYVTTTNPAISLNYQKDIKGVLFTLAFSSGDKSKHELSIWNYYPPKESEKKEGHLNL